ncbi:MAG: TOBE domain-containing protein, partial [Desulfovibrio sp.]
KAYAVIKASEVMIGLGDHLPMSARNQFPGTVVSVQKGAVNAIVKAEVLGGNVISASITNASAEELGLAEGSKVLAIVKASSVMVAVD